ncbi:MAG TPA: AMP-binding protein, partial [Candidatus Saccharimonadales bacterium]|nr:AMP-binding protein [Candidatus Saccharimonadales bacterium]
MPGATRTTFQEMCAEALADPAAFWGRAAGELPWFRRWDSVFEADPPSFRWFVGGRTNLAWNALDHHVAAGNGERTALIEVNERGGERRFSYAELLARVERAAAGLRSLGIRRGDRLTIYMPTCAEAVVAMLATVRIGAIHSVVFAGFGHGALADRVLASGSRAILTADLTYRKGSDMPLLPIVRGAVDVADRETPGLVERVVVLRRGNPKPELNGPRELDWDAFIADGADHSGAHEEMEANEPAYILATSGTTAKPKLAVHVHGGYQVHIVSMGRWVFNLRPQDVFWATADIGWAVGHAYTVYAPLIVGCTSVAYEGALDYPAQDSAWELMARLGMTGVFTSPTAVRLLMRYGESGAKAHDLSRLERVVCAGEVLNAPAWEWLQTRVFDDRIPVIDNMWQTETGGPIFGNPYGIELMPIKPGSAGPALPGIDAAIISLDGTELGPNEKGIMVIRRPFPGLTPALWGDPARYESDYWGRVPGSYWVGDAAHIDEDGYAWFAGRADEIIKIASHRLGTIEVET